MIEFFREFHFLRPWCLIFLIPIMILIYKKINISESLSSWSFVCDKKLLDFLLIKNKQKRIISFKTLIYTGLVCATIAGAGPAWKKADIPTFVPENPTMFVLSMTQEMQLNDVSPSRLMRAKYAIVDIVQNVKNAQFGLEVYTKEPYIVSPITDDANIITNIMPQVTPDIMPDFGDRIDRAIELAVQKLKETGFNDGNIILFASDVGHRLDWTLKSAEKALSLGYDVNVVDVSYSGSDKLELLAKKGGGMYLKLRENNLNSLIKKLSDVNKKRMMMNKNMQTQYLDYGYYLLIIPLLCLLPLFRRGFLCLFALLFAFNAEASFLLNNNQEGFRLFNQEKYDEAYKKFDNPLWKSISLYKQNKLEEALQDIEKLNDEKSLYNKGVILTKLCKYDEAKKVFETVVKNFSDNDDAKFNLMAIEKLFERAKEDPSVLECGDNSSGGSGGESNNSNQNNSDNKDENSENQDNESNDKNDKNDNSDKNNNENNNDENGENQKNNEKSSVDDKKNNNSENEQNKENNKEKENNESANNEKSNNGESENNDKKNENKNNNDEKQQNDNKNIDEKNNENEEKNGVKDVKKEKESNKQEENEGEKENKTEKQENNNDSKSDENNGNKNPSKNKNSDKNDKNAPKKDSELKENKDGDGNKNNQNADLNNKEKNENNDDENGEKADENNENKNNEKNSKPEANKNKDGEKTDDFDAGDKLDDNKNNKEKGNIANMGDDVENEDEVDEKELLIQRKYREIPDDVGGLLREMIKKEYSKGRYKNENI